MYYVWQTIKLLLLLFIFAFLHYTLPQRDIVRIVDTEVRRVDFGENSIFWAEADSGQTPAGANRDVRFINAVKKKTYLLGFWRRDKTEVMVYRNEDTGWGWPPYFKLDSSNLQTEAADLVSKDKANPQWVAITHYGWRNELFSIFPNAVAVQPVDSPDVRLIPWFNILILTVCAGLGLGIYRMFQWFFRARIDPMLQGASDTWDAVDDYADDTRRGIRGWFERLRGR